MACPLPAQLCQTFPQTGAAAEVVDVLIELGQHGIGVAVGKSPVQILQAGSHAEDMAAQLWIAPGLVAWCRNASSRRT
jgi:hypothetical protein